MTVDREVAYPRPISRSPVAQPVARQLPAGVAIAGKHVRIEPLDPRVHAAELFQASHESDAARGVWDFLPWGPWQDVKGFASWCEELASESDRFWYAFRPGFDQRVRGMACYLNVMPAQATIEIGAIWFSPDMQRTRAATETLFLMLSDAMDDLNYRRMEWKCNALNDKSRAAARRLGFKFEGIFYNHMIVKGRNRDTAWYSILEHEWPEVRALITSWLGDENFDSGGRAQSSLSEMTARPWQSAD